MKFGLIAKEQAFFDLFERGAGILKEAADHLVKATEHFETLPEEAKELKRLEHEGDQVLHDIMARLNRSFITPIDREDIHKLASEMDDLLDLMEEAAERFLLYKVTSITPQAREIAKVIQQQVHQIQLVTPKLRDLRHERINEHLIEINRLENEGDRLLRKAIGALFDGTPDPIEVIKWRGLYELLEEATDKCEHVAITIEGIVLKNA